MVLVRCSLAREKPAVAEVSESSMGLSVRLVSARTAEVRGQACHRCSESMHGANPGDTSAIARHLAETSGDCVLQVVDVGRKVAVDFDCPRLRHNADEREVPVVELRRLSGADRVAELGLERSGLRPAAFERGASRLQPPSQLRGARVVQLTHKRPF